MNAADAALGYVEAVGANDGNMERASYGAMTAIVVGAIGVAVAGALFAPPTVTVLVATGAAALLGAIGATIGTKFGYWVYDNFDGLDLSSLRQGVSQVFENFLDAMIEPEAGAGDRLAKALQELGRLADPGQVLEDLRREAAEEAAGDGAAGDGAAGGNDDDTPSLPALPIKLSFPNFCDPPVSPLVLDLDGDGVELISLANSRALFDLDGDGFAQHTGWVASDDALLAIDRNGNGRIDDIGEVFGNGTTDGFTELRALDSNGDGRIDASDDRFDELLLWRDLNGNGWSEADELQSLADAGVASIDLNAATSDTTNAGHRISHTSSFTRTDGTTAPIVDAWFVNDRHISAYLPADGFTLHEDVQALPQLTGYGVVAPLSVAMTLDAGLRTLVTNLMRESDTLSPSDFRARVLQIVLDWTGADTVDSHSRGPNMDARHLAAMEALVGSGFSQFGRADPGPVAGAALEADFQNYIDALTVRLLAQSTLSNLLIDAKESPGTITASGVFSHPFSGLAALGYDPDSNALAGGPNTILGFYVRSHAEGSTPPLGIDDTIALLHMLRLDFGSDGTAYRAAVEAAFVAAGFEEAVAAGYADRAVETRLRVVNGTDGDDTIRGFDVDDAIGGGGGNDTLYGERGDDVLEGGAGADTLHGGYGADVLDGGAEADTLRGGHDDDTLAGGAGDDTLHGEGDDDRLTGGVGNDTLHGSLGSDTYVFNRGDGADTIEDDGSSLGTDRLVIQGYTPAQVSVGRVAGDSDDVVLTFTGTGDRITIRNTLDGSRSDTIERIEFDDGTVWTQADVRALLLTGADGDDTLRGFSTDDTIAGGAGADTLHGERGDDTLDGGIGNDTLYGGHDDDTIRGDGGDDVLYGGDGDDDLYGGADNDILHGSRGTDSFDGGAGTDTLDFSYVTTTNVVNFDLTAGLMTVPGFLVGGRPFTERLVSIENVIGTRGANTITGTDGANRLDGAAGRDTLEGAGGSDVLVGGAGADSFVFGADDGIDTIEDFEDGVDIIRFKIAGLTFAGLTITEDGDDVLIAYDAGDSIRLTDMSTEDLNASDFAFA